MADLSILKSFEFCLFCNLISSSRSMFTMFMDLIIDLIILIKSMDLIVLMTIYLIFKMCTDPL